MSVVSRIRNCACLTALALAAGATAQTWSGPIPSTPGAPYATWEDPANWSPATRPNSPTATAGFHDHAGDLGQQRVLISGTVTVGEIAFLPSPFSNRFYPVIQIGSTRTSAPATGSLTIAGSGITAPGPNAGAIALAEGSLIFTHAAVARTDITLGQDGSGFGTRSLIFQDQSSLRADLTATGRGQSTIEFRDQSVLHTGTLDLRQSATVVFRDRAAVVDGRIVAPENFSLNARINVIGTPDLSGLDIVGATGPGTRLDLGNATGPVALRSVSGFVDINLGPNTLVLDHLPAATNFTLDGVISGPGRLVLASNSTASILVRNAGNSYAGPTSVSGPGLFVHLLDGGRLNNVTLDRQATLGVTGVSVIGGDLTLLEGTLHLSNPVDAGLAVQGTATLAGTLRVEALPDSAQVGTHRYPFLTATAVTGRFAALTGLAATIMLQHRLDYGAKEVAVVIDQQSFAAVAAANHSARDFGTYLDGHTTAPSAGLRPLLAGLNQLGSAAAVIDSLAGLAPDRYAVLPALGFDAAAARHATVTAQLAGTRGAPDGATAFLAAGTRHARYDATATAPAARARANPGLAGVLWRHGSAGLGVFVATDHGRTELDDAGSRAESDELAFGAAGELRVGPAFGRVILSSGRTKHDLTRHVTGLLDETARARSASRRTDASLEVGRHLAVGRLAVSPSAGVLWSEWRMDDFIETGAPVSALALAGWAQRSVRSRLGFEAAPRAPGRLIPRLALQWVHEFNDQTGFATRLASDPGAGYRTGGRLVDRNLFAGSLTLEATFGQRGLGWLRLGGTRGDHSRTTSDISTGVQWRF